MKKLYFFKEFETIFNNKHKLWKTINNLLSSKLSNSSATKVIKRVDVKVDNLTDIAKHFNEFFCVVGQSLADKWPVYRYRNSGSFLQFFSSDSFLLLIYAEEKDFYLAKISFFLLESAKKRTA